MTVERSPDVVLADSEPRCTPSNCGHEKFCARARAPIPPKNASLGDFSLFVVPMFGCRQYRAIEWRRR